MKKIIPILLFLCLIGIAYYTRQKNSKASPGNSVNTSADILTPAPNNNVSGGLAIAAMRQKSYPGSTLSIENKLASHSNYESYLVSYKSEGLKLYGLLTLPSGKKPDAGWPVILFNHGYIPPSEYSTENSYAQFITPLASSGYIVFKPDYRGNGNSPGTPVQIYISPDYLTDSMNALSSIKKFKDADPQKIGVFGHSMGGNITLHQLVISKEFKAAEIISGVVGDESAILSWWDHRIKAGSITGNDLDTSYVVRQMIADHKTPATNPKFWNAIDPTEYISDITVPIEIQVGTADTAVPPEFSSVFRDALLTAGKTVEYRVYRGADHNLSPDTQAALTEAVAFFNKYLK